MNKNNGAISAPLQRLVRPRIAVYQLNIMGCFECPHSQYYSDPKNPAYGCSFKYGSLPETGFPEWCPLKGV